MDSQRAKARALEAEITALRRACLETQAPGDDDSQVRKSFQETHQSDSEEWGLSKDLRSHLGSLESELQFLSRLTGVSIRNYRKVTEDLTSTEMTETSVKKVLQRHRLSGTCHMITFQLEFQILEIQSAQVTKNIHSVALPKPVEQDVRYMDDEYPWRYTADRLAPGLRAMQNYQDDTIVLHDLKDHLLKTRIKYGPT